MPTPRADIHSIASGASLYAGIDAPVDLIRAPAAGVSNLAAAIGDSLTQHAFQSTPLYWQLGLIGAPLELLANSGKSGVSPQGLITQIEESYTNGSNPGMVDLPALGWVFLRIGTNSWPGITTVSEQAMDDFDTIVTRLKDFAEHVVIFPMPPVGGVTTIERFGVEVHNEFFKSYVLADASGRTHYIDDCAHIRNEHRVLPQFFASDEIHMNGAGAYQMGRSAKMQLVALFANQGYSRAPLVTDAADVYPTIPQWVDNPVLAGTGGSVGGGWTGTAPTGWTVGTNGSGLAGTASIVAADAGDTNTVPWLRITPSQSASARILVSMAASGRSITSSDPDTLEQIIELRFNSLRNFEMLDFWIQNNSGQKFTSTAYLKWGKDIGASGTAVLRQKFQRSGSTAGGTPTAYIYIHGANSASGSMGSVDIRCPSIEG